MEKLSILMMDIICNSIFSYLTPADSIEFLHSNRETYYSYTAWSILLKMMQLEDIYYSEIPSKIGISSQRGLVIHAIRRLGYNCSSCYIPLNGINGLFACTNICNTCAIKIFKDNNCPFVDGIVRFYLCGQEALTTRGQAFLIHPYWLSTDDSYRRVIQTHGNAFNLAQAIYEEKVKILIHTSIRILNIHIVY